MPLASERGAAIAPTRAALSQLLTTLAMQVDQGNIDAGALAPSLNAVESAESGATTTLQDLVNRLHAELTPAQRSELVDSLEAEERRGHFRSGHGPDAGGHHHGPGWGAERLGLTSTQRAQIAAALHATPQDGGAPGLTPDTGRFGMRGAWGERVKALESFRGDAFDASSLTPPKAHGAFVVKLAQAMVPVLSQAQRSTLAQELRERANHPARL